MKTPKKPKAKTAKGKTDPIIDFQRIATVQSISVQDVIYNSRIAKQCFKPYVGLIYFCAKKILVLCINEFPQKYEKFSEMFNLKIEKIPYIFFLNYLESTCESLCQQQAILNDKEKQIIWQGVCKDFTPHLANKTPQNIDPLIFRVVCLFMHNILHCSINMLRHLQSYDSEEQNRESLDEFRKNFFEEGLGEHILTDDDFKLLETVHPIFRALSNEPFDFVFPMEKFNDFKTLILKILTSSVTIYFIKDSVNDEKFKSEIDELLSEYLINNVAQQAGSVGKA